MSYLDDTATMDFGTYADEEAQGDGLTRVQWRNGDPKTRTGGYFFIDGEKLGDVVPGAPWVAHEEYFESSGKHAKGYKAEALPIMVICARSQPLRYDANKMKTWLEKWETGAAMHADVLLIAKGLEALGPVVWSTNSTKTAFAIIGRANPKRGDADGILASIKNKLLKPASSKRDLTKQPWLFWATVATERDAKGIVYTATPGPKVTRPVADIPATVDRAYLESIYVGKELAEYGEQMRRFYDEWKQAKMANVAPATSQPGGKNAPQPVEEDELF